MSCVYYCVLTGIVSRTAVYKRINTCYHLVRVDTADHEVVYVAFSRKNYFKYQSNMTTNVVLVLTLALGCFIQIADMAYLDVASFFNVRGNLTRVSWAHAVNSQSLLNNALNSTVMMLEADVVIGNLTNSNSSNIPIMAHPPQATSDLSLEMFLTQVLTFNNNQGNATKKGVKLDFKTIEALENSVSRLQNMYNSMNYPVWINADIISGPVNAITTPVNPTRFFNATSVFQNSTLSIGWTTSYPNGTTNASYTNNQISNMLTSIQQHNVNQSITFPVRAGIAAGSISQMNTLIRNVSGSTLTIWSSDGDFVNVTALRNLIREVGIGRVFIDVPDVLERQLNLHTLGGAGMLTPLVSVLTVMFALIYML